MMPKTKPKNPDEDEAQSKRFLDLAGELEAAGDLNPTEGERAFERLTDKALPRSLRGRTRHQSTDAE